MDIFCADTNRKRTKDDRLAITHPPKYQIGVLEEGWQHRSREDEHHGPHQQKKHCLPPFKGCSIYKTSYKPPPTACYERDDTAYYNKDASEGQSKLIGGDDDSCRENFTTTTDLVYRILPQLCPKLRQYNSNALEWFPAQNFLPCYGNLTQHGLKEAKRKEWEADLRIMAAAGPPKDRSADGATEKHVSSTTYWDHFREPPHQYLVKDRKALKRLFSSSMDSNNNDMANQTLRGKCSLQVPMVDASERPMPECRYPLPILPTLPEEAPYRIGTPPPPPSSRRPKFTGSTLHTRRMQHYPLRFPLQVC